MAESIGMEEALQQAGRVHFIGIGGAGMFPLAEILHSRGYEITGSDNNESETLGRARALGIPVALGQRAENITGAGLIVYTAALLPDNPELVAAKASGIPTFERAALLGAVTRQYSNCICVCGTHGKTTTTAMLTQIMLQAELSPTAVIGGKLPLTGTNGLVGESEHMVCEACEFQDTFLRLAPDVAVILNIDEDHMEYFKTLENLIASFTQFAAMTTKAVLYNGDDANTRCALESVKCKRLIPFGRSEENDFRAINVTMEGAFASYDLLYHGEFLTRIRLQTPGEHNVSNSMAAIAAAMFSGASILDCEKGVAAFRGAGRRFEILGEFHGVTLADDYAHHPRELAVTLAAAKQMHHRKVWAVFQPFTFSRTARLLDDFAAALALADHVVLTKIMGSREINTYGVTTAQLAEKIPGSVWFAEFDETAAYITQNAQQGDLVITLGCGDIYKAGKLMIRLWEAQE
ncbi:MAG: UDP-N-acetylmuramate--L-alanine ligase [Oscillospiraceae bacterium]|jgi:UDP-N-acetylmuramate--alanine ligase|nr:UDP-N-acetylmuramate--L-alanine ligase [Oscillospiraceae bacterium]